MDPFLERITHNRLLCPPIYLYKTLKIDVIKGDLQLSNKTLMEIYNIVQSQRQNTYLLDDVDIVPKSIVI